MKIALELAVLMAVVTLTLVIVFRAAMEMLARTIDKAIRESRQSIAPQVMYFEGNIVLFDWESGTILSSRDGGETWTHVSRLERRWFH